MSSFIQGFDSRPGGYEQWLQKAQEIRQVESTHREAMQAPDTKMGLVWRRWNGDVRVREAFGHGGMNHSSVMYILPTRDGKIRLGIHQGADAQQVLADFRKVVGDDYPLEVGAAYSLSFGFK